MIISSMWFIIICLFIDSIRCRTVSIENVALGFSCEHHRHCSNFISNSICLDRRCVCRTSYKPDGIFRCIPNNKIRQRRQTYDIEMLGEECESNDQCRRTPVDGSKICSLNQCQCSPGYVPIDSYRCIRDLETKNDEMEPPGFGSMCSTKDDCRNPLVEFECSRGTCVCLPGFVPLGKYICYNLDGNDPKFDEEHLPTLGQTCRTDEFCREIVDESQCENRRCVCREGFRQIDSITCLPIVETISNEKQSLSGRCSTDDQCRTTNSKCFENICSCREGFYPIDDWTCLEDSDKSEEEIPATTATTTTTTTTTTTSVFRWWPWSSSTTTSSSSLVDAKKTFRFRCLLNRQCASVDRNSHCTLFGRCICNNGFHLQLIDGKERCVEDDCD